MRHSRHNFRWSIWLWLLAASAAMAQHDPHIGYIYPAGGRQGTTFQATIGGQYLNNAASVYISGTGASVAVPEQEKPITPKEQIEFKEQMAKFKAKRKQGIALTPAEKKQAEEIKRKFEAFARKRANPSLGEFVTIQVTLATNAAAGRRELRLGTKAGLSNPLVFMVGELPEFSKKDWKNTPDSKFNKNAKPATKATEIKVTLPAVLNGQIPPGGEDLYRFPARAGQQLVVAVSARELIPYIADAVPGWFQATVALYDAKGKELAYTDDYRFHPDPVLFYKIPADGDYVLEIKDALYRGREDFVYRITAGELPFITGVFPLGGKIGTQAAVAVGGWNLPARQMTLDLRNKTPGIYPVFEGQRCNLVPFAIDTLPECLEKEPDNTAVNAQPVALPIIINGRIDQPGDEDVFRFKGNAGEPIVAEVHARRLDSPLDSMLRITDSAGRQIAANDDHEDKGSGLNTHHADSYIATTLPASGAYFVHIGDTQHGGGGAHSYRLRISAPRPDFELRTTPSSLSLRGGASVPLTVYALRKDGFTGAIALSLKDAPEGFTLTSAPIQENQDQARLTLNAPASAATVPFSLHIEGRATIQGRKVSRTAVPADDMMQAFAYRHLVPAQDQKVAVMGGRFKIQDASKILSPTPVKINAGGLARVRVHIPIGPMMTNVEFELSDPPEGITLKSATRLEKDRELVLQADAAKARPGMKGTLIVKVSGERTAAASEDKDKKKTANSRRIPIGTLPAIPFIIIP
jgi:hypothetical protein